MRAPPATPGTDWSRNYVTYPGGRVRRLLPVECERIQGFPEDWTVVPPGNGYGDMDKIDSLRYNALGNAVTVPVAEWLAGRVKRYLARQKKRMSAKKSGRKATARSRAAVAL